MFVISQSATYRFPVKFHTPKEDGTGTDENSFTAVFKRMTVPEIQELTARRDLDDVNFARAVMVGWDDVVDQSGEKVEFSKAMFETLLTKVGFASAVTRAFTASLEDAPRKN